jgi:hypothetical protein
VFGWLVELLAMSKIDEVISGVFFVLFLSLFTFMGATVGEGIDLMTSTSKHVIHGHAMWTTPLAWVGFYMFWAWINRERARLA